jgi:3-oxoacyl-[acyl-carrier protein] reductase
MGEFEGRTALVTGGARGIGRAVSRELAARGARVAVNSLTGGKEAAETVRSLAVPGIAVRADVTKEEDVARMVREVGPVDLLVNNAGFYKMAAHGELTPEVWRKTVEVNLTGAFLVTWAVKDSMIARKFGRIVNMSSISALAPRPWSMAYAASKAGLISFTKSCAAAFAPHGIRVNAIAPGLVETEMLHRSPGELIDQLREQTPLKRIAAPEEIAKLAAFLLSEGSSFVTGQTWIADGGRVMMP